MDNAAPVAATPTTAQPQQPKAAPAQPADPKAQPQGGDESAAQLTGKVVDVKLQRSWDLVSKKEAAARKLEQEVRTRQAELEARAKEYESRAAELKLAEDDPVGYLLKRGVSQEKIVEFIDANLGGKEKVAAKADPRLNEYEKKLAALEQQMADRARQERETRERAAAMQYVRGASELAAGDDFSVVRNAARLMGEDVGAMVYTFANTIYQQTGEVLTPDVALSKLRDVLGPRWQEVVGATQQQTAAPAEPEKTETKRDRKLRHARSLSNSDRLTTSAQQTDSDRRARAMAAARSAFGK